VKNKIHSLSFFLVLLVLGSTLLGAISIGALDSLTDYAQVVIEGVVTVVPGPFERNIFVLQDATGGINVYGQGVDFSDFQLERGDTVRVKGYVYTHRQNREVVVETPQQVEKLEIKSPLPEPLWLSLSELSLPHLQGMLVQVHGKFSRVNPPYFYMEDESGEGLVYIRENTGIFLNVSEGIPATVTGVIGQYNNLVELWPRSMEDLVLPDVNPPTLERARFLPPTTLAIRFSEPVDPTSIVSGKSIVVRGGEISQIHFLSDRTLQVLLEDTPVSPLTLFVRGVQDFSGNVSLLRKMEVPLVSPVTVLFDESHGQTAGNADWTITGGFSDFADALSQEGFEVLPSVGSFSEDLLLFCDVLVLSEPNRPYDPQEIAQILAFLGEDGKGVFFIADHGGADRNGNGWDAVRIFNVFAGPEIGFSFTGDDMEAPDVPGPVHAPFGNDVQRVGLWNGSSIQIQSGVENVHTALSFEGKPYIVYGNLSDGRFAAIGDSSPFDDGTGAAGNQLYNGWFLYDNARLGVQVVRWLAGIPNP